MSRIVFRLLVFATLAVMFIARRSGGQMDPQEFLPFYYWFIASAFVFAGFGIAAAVKARRDPAHRRAYYLDIVLAAIWIPYWWANLR